jgi:CheY-like chemotaxis protein
MRSKLTNCLIVDDEPQILDLLADLLGYFKLTTIKAKDGIEAWEIFQDNPQIQLVITDLNMPKMSGLDLLAKIKTHAPQIPVIIITAYANLLDVSNKFNGHFKPDGYIPKPFDIHKLMEVIDRVREVYYR